MELPLVNAVAWRGLGSVPGPDADDLAVHGGIEMARAPGIGARNDLRGRLLRGREHARKLHADGHLPAARRARQG